MKITTAMKSKINFILYIVLISVTASGCFESNSEDPAPDLNSTGTGGGGTTLGANDSLRVAVDSTGGSLDVLRNDSNNVQITEFDTTSAQGGSVSRVGTTGYLQYIPQAGYSGTDSFTYTILDGNGNNSKLTVNVTVNDDIIASGRDYFNRECGICHQAGGEDQQNAFNATDLVLSASNFDYDMSLSDQLWNPPLMRYYSNLSQIELDGLRAYIGLLRNP